MHLRQRLFSINQCLASLHQKIYSGNSFDPSVRYNESLIALTSLLLGDNSGQGPQKGEWKPCHSFESLSPP